MSATEIKFELLDLTAERAAAALAGDPEYVTALDDELEDLLSAYVGAAVTEIASLRAEISGPLRG